MKRFFLLFTLIVSLASFIPAQTISVGGDVKGPSFIGAVNNMFTVVFSNNGGTVNSGGYSPVDSSVGYVNTNIPYGWYGTITPIAKGFVFTPGIDSITGKFPLIKTPNKSHFTAIDTMRPTVYFRKTFGTIQLGLMDSIKTTVWDNCQRLTKYRYEITYNKGQVWAPICSILALTVNYLPNLSAHDTAAIQCRKSQAFTPTQAADSCQIRVTVYDREGNFGSVVSPAFKVDNPTSIKISPKFIGAAPKTIHSNFDIAGRKIYAPRERRIYIFRRTF